MTPPRFRHPDPEARRTERFPRAARGYADVVRPSKLFREVATCLGLPEIEAATVLSIHMSRVDGTPATFSGATLLAVADELRKMQLALVPTAQRPELRARLEALLERARAERDASTPG